MKKTWLNLILEFVVIFVILINLVESKCWQKNTKREAHRDIYMCQNQYFEQGKRLPDPENCDCYYECDYLQRPCYVCCPNGQHFHPKKLECILGHAFRCQNKPPKYRCEGHGLFRNQENCRKYWDCRQADLMPVEEACNEDHHWDDQAKICRKDSEVSGNSCNS